MWQSSWFVPRLISFFIIGCLTFSYAHSEVGSGLLWQIQKPLHPVNFLFGTIHVDDKRVKALNSNIKRRFNEASTLCLEVLPDREAQIDIGLAMLLPEEEHLDHILGEPLFDRVSFEMNRLGVTQLETIRLKPWAAMIVLSRPESNGGDTLDEQLFHWGNHQHKKLCALETLKEQLSIFDQLNYSDQRSLLVDTLDNISDLKDFNEALIVAYLSGSLDEIYRQSLEMELGNTELAKRLREMLIDKRNETMVERIVVTLNKGHAFIAVGALHLPGKKGLLQLLRNKGFIVTLATMSTDL